MTSTDDESDNDNGSDDDDDDDDDDVVGDDEDDAKDDQEKSVEELIIKVQRKGRTANSYGLFVWGFLVFVCLFVCWNDMLITS